MQLGNGLTEADAIRPSQEQNPTTTELVRQTSRRSTRARSRAGRWERITRPTPEAPWPWWPPDARAATAITGSLDPAAAPPPPPTANRPPVLAPIGSQSVSEGQPLTFTATATDPDGNALTFSGGSLPTGATLTPAGAFSWTPSFHGRPELPGYRHRDRQWEPSGERL